MGNLGKAIAIVARIYADRVYGEDRRPYLLHCLNVMHHVSPLPDEHKRIAAVLHAAVEESQISLGELEAEGFVPEVVEALRVLPRHSGESAVECAKRVCSNHIARAVKISDVAVHMNEDHLGGSAMNTAERLEYAEVTSILFSSARNAP